MEWHFWQQGSRTKLRHYMYHGTISQMRVEGLPAVGRESFSWRLQDRSLRAGASALSDSMYLWAVDS